MTTKQALKAVFSYIRENDLVVSSLGRTAEETYLLSPDKDQILFVDCMGAVTGLSLGVAIACPQSRVFAFETDGSFMYDSTILHTIASEFPTLKNFLLVILDNGLLESGGNLSSRISNIDWIFLAKSWGLTLHVIEDESTLFDKVHSVLERNACEILLLKIDNSNIESTCFKDIDGIESRYRFKRFINEKINKGIIKPCVKN